MNNRNNTIWIVMDALRAQNLSCYGYHKTTSPVIDSLAFNSIKCSRAYSVGVCSPPSTGCLLTGMYASVHQYRSHRHKLLPDVPTLPEYLSEQGYRTGALFANPLINRGSGFDRFDTMRDLDDILSLIDQQGRVSTIDTSSKYKHRSARAEDLVELAIDFIEANDEKPFFLLIWFMDTHENFHLHHSLDADIYAGVDFKLSMPKDEYNFLNFDLDILRSNPQRRKEVLAEFTAAYDGEIKYVDTHIGMLLDYLRNNHLSQNTNIVITSDHGTGIGEHGLLTHRYPSLFEEIVHVPLLFHLPGVHRAKPELNMLVRTMDIMPTLLDLADVPIPTDIQGKSLLPFITGESEESDLPCFIESDYLEEGHLVGVIEGPWKFIIDKREGGGEHLYNLVWDPKEEVNFRFHHNHQSTVKKMQKKIEEYYSFCEEVRPKVGSSRREELDEQILSRLRALGYIE